MKNMKKISLSLLILLAFSIHSFAQISEQEVDNVVNRTLTAFNVPGIAVAIVKDGKVAKLLQARLWLC